MSVLKSLAFDEICHRRIIRASDVTQLRGLFLANAFITSEEVEALLTIDDTCRLQDETWGDFLSDAVTDYVVRDLHPKGHVTVDNAAWLRSAVAPEGRIPTAGLMRVLMRVMTTAQSMPASLRLFALQQVIAAVETGAGPLRAGAPTDAKSITAADAAYVAAILGTGSQDCPDLISVPELKALLELDAASTERDPSWTALMQSLIAAAALAAVGYPLADRHSLLNCTVWLADGPKPQDFIAALTGEPAPAPRPRGGPAGLIARLERQRIEIMTGEAIAPVHGQVLAVLLAGSRAELRAPIEVIAAAGLSLPSDLAGLHVAA